jgi:hypothetical protein
MGGMFKRGVGALALLSLTVSQAEAKHLRPTHCATPTEASAIAATAIQQELMVAALTCNQIANFNAFQTNFSAELRSSDHALMKMFMRLYGGRGSAEYHGFKTRLANNSEIRSIHANSDFCTAAGNVFSAALAPIKPALRDVVSAVQVIDPSPVDSCKMELVVGHKPPVLQATTTTTPAPTATSAGPTAPVVQATSTTTPAAAATSSGAQAVSAVATVVPPSSSPPAPAVTSATPAPAVASATPATTVASAASSPAAATPAPSAQTAATPDQHKKGGWFSGIFK